MIERENIIDKKFGKLLVIENKGIDKDGNSIWLCKCDCGNEKIYRRSQLLNKQVVSCGCWRKERLKKHGYRSDKKHIPKEYSIWQLAKDRCYNINNKRYKDYGGRGINICDEWKNNFEKFLKDMGNCPKNKNSIDRINNNGNYEPGNCKWSDNLEQANNKRNNHYVEFNGQIKTLAEWSRELNINYATIHSRLQRGWNIEKTLTTEVIKNDKKN
jgi:hypothetical protein